MADNTKIERIALSKIFVEQKFDGDLYWDDFFLHPAAIACSQGDIDVFHNWKIAEFALRNRQTRKNLKDPAVMAAMLKNSAQIIEDDRQTMQQAQRLHTEICHFVGHCHQLVLKQTPFVPGEPVEKLKHFIESIRSMGASILRFGELQTGRESYVEIHSANSLILAVMLGNYAKLPHHRLLNLVLAALFHEVGLHRFVQAMAGKGQLSNREFEAQKQHVESGCKLLKPYNLPTESLEIILHHHEHLDGSGYPHGIGQNEISDLSCYLSLVCSYIGMTCRRFQKPSLPYVAMTTLLREARSFHNLGMVHSLLLLLSLYPVSSGVCLNNGTIGKVLRANPKDPKLPVVQILLDAEGELLEQSIIVQTNEQLHIERAVPYSAIARKIAESP